MRMIHRLYKIGAPRAGVYWQYAIVHRHLLECGHPLCPQVIHYEQVIHYDDATLESLIVAMEQDTSSTTTAPDGPHGA